MAPDMEARASTAIDAFECLAQLIEAQGRNVDVDGEQLAALMRVVVDAAKKAIPSNFIRVASNDGLDQD